MDDYPVTMLENIDFRARMLTKAKEDEKLRTILYEKCSKDILFFINCFCWTFDPRLSDPELPFILYPKQTEFIKKIESLYARAVEGQKINFVLDKPRDVGATFTLMAWCLHHYLFDSFNARIGSRKEDYVDKTGETDTLFYKLDFMLERIPSWLKGVNKRGYMMLSKADNENQVSGESANPNFSRGGRKSVVIFDEHGFWEWAKSSWESSGESTNFRIALSSPPETGKDSYFFNLLAGRKGRVETFEFDWKDVPKRDQGWFTEAKETKSEEEFAREVLKSYEGTTKGKVYALTLQLAHISDKVEYDPQLPLFISWDFGLDQTAMIWLQKDISTGKVRIIDSYHNSDKEMDFFVPFVTGNIESGIHTYNQHELNIIKRHKGWSRTITHFGDPDVKKRDRNTKSSTRDLLQKYGIYIQLKDWAGRQWKDLRDKTQLLIRRLDINEKRNEYFLSCLRMARYPEKREGSQSTQPITKPIHDWTSHFRTALEYFADNEPKIESGATSQEVHAARYAAKTTIPVGYGRREKIRGGRSY